MHVDSNWLDEWDDDEQEIDRMEDEARLASSEPLEPIELLADELAELDAEDALEAVSTDDHFDVVSQYFQESAQHRLLTGEQEQELTLAVERGRSARQKLERSRPALSETTRRQLRRDIEQAQEAREELVRSNARLVISVAKRYQNLGLPLMDLIQEGNIGLLRAIERFEPGRGLRFSTYATWWVRQGIGRAVANQGRTIRLPAYLQDRVQHLSRATQTLEQSLGRAPNETELAVKLAISPADIRSLQAVVAPVISLDDSLSEMDDESSLEQLEDNQVTPVDELVAGHLLREAMDRALEQLPARNAQIVRLRYGLDDDQPHTLEAIAQKLNLSRERVRQIEREAFSRLRMSIDVRRQWFQPGA